MSRLLAYVLSAAALLASSPAQTLGQSSSVPPGTENCGANGAHNATVLFPRASLSLSPDSVWASPHVDASLSPWRAVVALAADGTCVGATPLSGPGPTALAVAGRDDIAGHDVTTPHGLAPGDAFQLALVDSTGRRTPAVVSYARCEALSTAVQPLCREDGRYRDDAVYVVRSIRFGSSGAGSDVGDGSASTGGPESSAVAADLRATLEGDAVHLQWQGPTGSQRPRFWVERRVIEDTAAGAPPRWERRALVAPSDLAPPYRFVDRSLPPAADRVAYRVRAAGGRPTKQDRPAVSQSVAVDVSRVESLTLHPPRPNPARTQATVRYGLPRSAEVRLGVYDLLGRRIATLAGGQQAAGRYEVRVDVSSWASGTYFVRLSAAERWVTRSLTVVR
jgi:hypothetical protein